MVMRMTYSNFIGLPFLVIFETKFVRSVVD